MDSHFADFERSYYTGNGEALSASLSPIAPDGRPGHLREFYKSTNSHSVRADIERKFGWRSRSPVRDEKEATAWVDIFVAYWTAIGYINSAEDAQRRGQDFDAGWAKVYEAWKDLTQVLIRGYSGAGIGAWTLPCLYAVGKHLRIFAIKADEFSANSAVETTVKSVFQDDIVSDAGQNEKLEDAARIINRIFQLCFSDRYVTNDTTSALVNIAL